MKPTWTKVYGPPFDYAKQRERERAHWSKLTVPDPPAGSFYEALGKMMEDMGSVYAKQFEPNKSDALLLAQHCPLSFANGDFNAMLGMGDTPEGLLRDRLREIGVPDRGWLPYLRHGLVLVNRDGGNPFLADKAWLWTSVLVGCGLPL